MRVPPPPPPPSRLFPGPFIRVNIESILSYILPSRDLLRDEKEGLLTDIAFLQVSPWMFVTIYASMFVWFTNTKTADINNNQPLPHELMKFLCFLPLYSRIPCLKSQITGSKPQLRWSKNPLSKVLDSFPP